MEFREMLSLARSWIVVIVATIVIAAGAALFVSLRTAPTYESTATVLVGPPLSSASISFTDLTIAQDLAQTYAQVATSRSVLDAVAEAVGIPTTESDLATTVTARNPPTTSFVIITASAHTADQAAAIANGVAAELIKQGPSAEEQSQVQTEYQNNLTSIAAEISSVQEQLDKLRALSSPTDVQVAQMASLQTQLTTLQSTRASIISSAPSAGANVLTVIDPAVPPTLKTGPSTIANVAFGVAIGLVVALLIAFVVENLRRAGMLRRPGAATVAPDHTPDDDDSAGGPVTARRSQA